MVALGANSVLLYALLFWYSDSLTAIAQATRQGKKLYAIVPIAIALVFSLVHGTFTARLGQPRPATAEPALEGGHGPEFFRLTLVSALLLYSSSASLAAW